MKSIIELAREAGMSIHTDDRPYMEMLERFAQLVREQRDAELLAGSGEPCAFEVYVELVDNSYLVDSLDDDQLIDDCTNHDAVVTNLYTADQLAAAVLRSRDAALGELETKVPGGKHTDKWESSRIADYNQGWNDYRKACAKAIRQLKGKQ